MENIREEIDKLKKQKNAIILAHYYVDEEVQKIADYVGDSYYLAKKAMECSENVICFAGVSFMGESAKILNPNKTVIMPDPLADCPMAHMAEEEKIMAVKEKYKDVAVVCYINSTAKIKAQADVCVTSSNAVKIVKKLSQKNVFFIPDNNLGRYAAEQVPEKNFIFNNGFCHVHTSILAENVEKAKEANPQAEVLVHPECTLEVLKLADYIGSTAGIIEYASNSSCESFIICTEMGILYELKQKNPNKKFYAVGHRQFCPNMKRITLEKIKRNLEQLDNQVEIEKSLRIKAKKPLDQMLLLAE